MVLMLANVAGRYFYGNGVFRSTFVTIIAGKNASVLENWLYSWINAGVQLVCACSFRCVRCAC